MILCLFGLWYVEDAVVSMEQARLASGHLHMRAPMVFHRTRDARPHLRAPVWCLGLRLKPVQSAMVSAMVLL